MESLVKLEPDEIRMAKLQSAGSQQKEPVVLHSDHCATTALCKCTETAWSFSVEQGSFSVVPPSQASCVQLQNSSHLVSIQSFTESIYIETLIYINLIGLTNVWIGLNDPEKNHIWNWSDGSDFNYIYWGIFEPGNADSGDYCVELVDFIRKPRWREPKERVPQ